MPCLCLQSRTTSLAFKRPADFTLEVSYCMYEFLFLGRFDSAATLLTLRFLVPIFLMIQFDRRTLKLMRDPTGKIAFSKPVLYILSFVRSKSGTIRLCTFLICLPIASFTPTKRVLSFLGNYNWYTDYMLTRATWRAFFSDSKQCASLFLFPNQAVLVLLLY